jgi:hypothetical protein
MTSSRAAEARCRAQSRRGRHRCAVQRDPVPNMGRVMSGTIAGAWKVRAASFPSVTPDSWRAIRIRSWSPFGSADRCTPKPEASGWGRSPLGFGGNGGGMNLRQLGRSLTCVDASALAAERSLGEQIPRQSTKFALVAEGEGFEPSVDQRPTTVFETAPFNRSGTPPKGSR